MVNKTNLYNFGYNLFSEDIAKKYERVPMMVSRTVCVYIYIYIYTSWPTIVEGDLKAPFSIATTLRCKGQSYSFLWIASLTLDQCLIMLSVKQGSIMYHFLRLWYDLTWN